MQYKLINLCIVIFCVHITLYTAARATYLRSPSESHTAARSESKDLFLCCVHACICFSVFPRRDTLCDDMFFPGTVSLYGNSYINLPTQEAKNSTNIRLKFKTSLQNGLILATIGRIDYILLSLDNARLKVDLKIADFKTEVRMCMFCGIVYVMCNSRYGHRQIDNSTIDNGMR